MVRRSEAIYENKLKQERERAREELADLKATVDKLTAENLLISSCMRNAFDARRLSRDPAWQPGADGVGDERDALEDGHDATGPRE